jgi:serine/threonine protein phosphatase PrpC
MVAKTKYRCAGESHPGMVRQNNEDRVHFDPDRGLFMVIDGIGGQAAGEQAADIALSRVRARLERQTGSPEERIREAITVANNEILRMADTRPKEWRGMACVLTVAIVENGRATIGHVGDSRLYQIRRGGIQKITHDHSPVGEREDHGEISETEAMRHPRRNEVYRDVGSEQHAPDDPGFIEVLHIPFEPDSALLLCSDGLSDQVTSTEIQRIVLANAGHPYGAVHELIDAANRAGGKDNVTVLIVEGEEFAAARVTLGDPAPNHGNLFTRKPAAFIYGLALGAALLFAALHYLNRQAGRPDAPPVPRTLRVGSGGFGKISEALNQAQPGDTIEVSSGEYPEQLRLISGVTVKGLRPDVPLLRAAPVSDGPPIAIVAEGIHDARVSGFRVVSDAGAPLAAGVLIANSDLELQDMDIVGAQTGIEIRGPSQAVLRANSVTDSPNAGIRISGDATPWLLHNAILRNGRKPSARAAASGVLIEDSARPVLIGNTFQDNGGRPVTLPEGMDNGPVEKFNFFLPAKPAARTRAGGR